MSSESLAVVQAVIDATERRDWNAVYSRYAPDIVFDFTRSGNDVFAAFVEPGGVFHGHDAWRTAMRAWNEAWRVHRYRHEGLFDADDRVVHLLSQWVVGRRTGLEFTMSYAHVWTVRDGLIVRMDTYDDREQALRDAGLDASLAMSGTPRSGPG
jgi:ketosteroid isomerase-like protein